MLYTNWNEYTTISRVLIHIKLRRNVDIGKNSVEERGRLIEEYIEKDIMRQIKIVEFLFELKQINIQKVAEKLGVSGMTVRRDVEKILILDSRIKLIERKATYITVEFLSGTTRYDLVKKIYEQSFFLRTSALYLMNERNYLKIAEKVHISVAKVFTLKKKVEEFFQNTGIMTDDGNFNDNEFKYRLITVSIWMRMNSLDNIIDQKVYREAEKIVDSFRQTFSNEISLRERHFFIFNVYITLKRKGKNLVIPNQDFQFAYQEPLYKQIEQLLEDQNLNENEITYLTIVYRLLNQNFKSYHLLKMEYQQFLKMHINRIPELIELVHLFENTFQRELFKDIMFEKPFIKFLMSIFLQRSMFLVEKHYYLSEKQEQLCDIVEALITSWSKKNGYQISLENRALEKFCLQASEILVNNASKKWYVFIIAEDEIAHIAYREWIDRRLNTEHIIIDNALYYSLDTLPVYIDTESSIIICERSLASYPFKQYREIKMFPVTLFSINEDLQVMFNYVFNK